MILSLIVAHDSARVIGRNGEMPWHLPADLAYFKETTMGHQLIVGRKTFASIGRALPGRRMIVVSRGRPELPEGVDLAGSLDAAIERAREAVDGEVFIAGGGEIYRQALPRVHRIYLTLIGDGPDGPARARPTDTLFPEWNRGAFRQIESVERLPDEDNSRPLKFLVFDRLI